MIYSAFSFLFSFRCLLCFFAFRFIPFFRFSQMCIFCFLVCSFELNEKVVAVVCGGDFICGVCWGWGAYRTPNGLVHILISEKIKKRKSEKENFENRKTKNSKFEKRKNLEIGWSCFL